MTAPPPVVRRAGPDDQPAIEALFTRCFSSPRPADHWTWQRTRPAGETIPLVMEQAGRVIGYSSLLPSTGWTERGATNLSVVHGSDTMVDPDSQGGGGFGRLWDGLVEARAGTDLHLSFPIDAIRAWHERRGTQHLLGRLRGWVRFVEPAALADKWSLGPPMADVAARTVVGTTRMLTAVRSRRFDMRDVALADLDERFEQVARAVARDVEFMLARDVATIEWRWFRQPDRDWRMRAAMDRTGALMGWAVLGRRAPRAHQSDGSPDPVATGLVVDVVAPRPSVQRALLLDAVDILAAAGCAVVEFDCLDPRRWAGPAIRSAGFLPRAIGPHATISIVDDRWSRAGDRAAWFLTLGDTDLA